MYEALVFRAELWCCKSDMLVRRAWSAAQKLPGRTFANASLQALTHLGFPEVFQFPGWAAFLEHGVSVLPSYKAALKERLVSDSISRWRAAQLRSHAAVPSLLAQQYPCSAGARLLDAGYRDVLPHADQWDLLRLGFGAAYTLGFTRGSQYLCKLCGCPTTGMAHLLASCHALSSHRETFLDHIGFFYSAKLQGSPAGDWPTLVLSPHLDLAVLRHAVVFGAAVVGLLEQHEGFLQQENQQQQQQLMNFRLHSGAVFPLVFVFPLLVWLERG